MSTVDLILERWPLDAMLARCGIDVPLRGKFCSPFRPDGTPSCERYGETIRDRSLDQSYDAIKVFAEHMGLSNSDAIRKLAAELPGRQPRPKPQIHKLTIPPLQYAICEAHEVAKLRGLSVEAIDFAGFMGTLGFAEIGGFHCWVLTDADKRLAEARRIDGKAFPAVGSLGERKAHTLRGSCKSWPLGMNPPGVKVPSGLPVWLVEGGPDYLAACDVLMHSGREFLPVSILGAGQRIHSDALPFFRSRDVLILGHPGEAGFKAINTWSNQLRDVGASAIPIQLQGGDLNDIIKTHGPKAVATQLNREFTNH